MAETLTTRLKIIKNDDAEFVDVDEINAGWDKADNHFIPACKIWRSNDQSINSGVGQVQLAYDTTIIDTFAARSEGPMADLANERIIIRKAGLYLVRSNLLWNTGTAAGLMRADLAVNGTTNSSVFTHGVATAETQVLTDLRILAANDVITAFVQQTTGAARLLTNNTYQNVFTLEAIWLGGNTEV